MALSATGEGCHKEMAAILEDLVNGILTFLKDPVKIKSEMMFNFNLWFMFSIHEFDMQLAMP